MNCFSGYTCYMHRLESNTITVLTSAVSGSVHSIIYKPLERELTLKLSSENEHKTDSSYSGSTIFPYSGRIAYALFDGILLDRNDGINSLHGGSAARDAVYETVDYATSFVKYRTVRKKGDDNLNSFRVYTVTYSLHGSELIITHEMESDVPVLTDTTCHLYFNLSGEKTIFNHAIKVSEDAVVLNNPDHTAQKLIKTSGGVFDLNQSKKLGEICTLPQLSFSCGLNNAYRLVNDKLLVLESDDLIMEATSDSAAVVLYSGGYLKEPSSHIAVEFEDLPFNENRTVTDRYKRSFTYRFIEK